jgi:hypothetical protein
MTRRALQPLFRIAALTVLGLGFAFIAAGPAGAAGDGYGTSTPPNPPVAPTGCPTGTVITSSTLGAGGGTISGTVDGSLVTVTVPAGSFPDGAQVAITDIFSTTIAPTGDTIVLAFGVNFCSNGSKVMGSFSPPVTVTVSNPGILPGQTLFLQTSTGLVPVTTAQIGTGSFTLTIDSDPDFVLVTASGPTESVISGATTVVTGKPFLLEGLVAGALLFAGGALLFVRLRLRHR